MRSLRTSLARTTSSRLRGPLVALVLTAASTLVAAPRTAAAESKIAVIDVQRAMLETEEGLRVQATLKKLFESRQVELSNKERTLQQEKEAIEKDAQVGKVPKEHLQRRFDTLQKNAMDLQALSAEYNRELQRKQGEMTTPIYQRIMGIVRRIAAQEGYEMVVDKSAVPYFRADLELTDRAIQMYNSNQAGDLGPSKAPAGGKAPKPADKPAPKPAPKK